MKKHLNSTFTTIATIITIVTGGYACFEIYRHYRVRNFEGRWDITFHIKESSYKPYINKTTTHRVIFTQDGETVKGAGEMWKIDGKDIPFSQHIRLEGVGKVDGNKLVFLFTQFGAKRTTQGELKITIDDDDRTVSGEFYQTAADSKGPVKGEKEQSN